MVQARREIDQEWSAARILEKNNSKKEKAEDIMARQQNRLNRAKDHWNRNKAQQAREQELKKNEEETFKPRTNHNSAFMQIQKAMRQQLAAQS